MSIWESFFDVLAHILLPGSGNISSLFVVLLLNACVISLCVLLGGWYWAAAPVLLVLPWIVLARMSRKPKP